MARPERQRWAWCASTGFDPRRRSPRPWQDVPHAPRLEDNKARAAAPTEQCTIAHILGWKLWVDWHNVIAPDNRVEIEALQSDRGEHLGYIRVVGRRRSNICLDDPAWLASVPSNYEQNPLLR